ncbi:hypothetical protein NL529_30600, partial [Klebsiella pneumoniae]|nr:hypothetical protein [Klebsiella pneumoniae]
PAPPPPAPLDPRERAIAILGGEDIAVPLLKPLPAQLERKYGRVSVYFNGRRWGVRPDPTCSACHGSIAYRAFGKPCLCVWVRAGYE